MKSKVIISIILLIFVLFCSSSVLAAGPITYYDYSNDNIIVTIQDGKYVELTKDNISNTILNPNTVYYYNAQKYGPLTQFPNINDDPGTEGIIEFIFDIEVINLDEVNLEVGEFDLEKITPIYDPSYNDGAQLSTYNDLNTINDFKEISKYGALNLTSPIKIPLNVELNFYSTQPTFSEAGYAYLGSIQNLNDNNSDGEGDCFPTIQGGDHTSPIIGEGGKITTWQGPIKQDNGSYFGTRAMKPVANGAATHSYLPDNLKNGIFGIYSGSLQIYGPKYNYDANAPSNYLYLSDGKNTIGQANMPTVSADIVVQNGIFAPESYNSTMVYIEGSAMSNAAYAFNIDQDYRADMAGAVTGGITCDYGNLLINGGSKKIYKIQYGSFGPSLKGELNETQIQQLKTEYAFKRSSAIFYIDGSNRNIVVQNKGFLRAYSSYGGGAGLYCQGTYSGTVKVQDFGVMSCQSQQNSRGKGTAAIGMSQVWNTSKGYSFSLDFITEYTIQVTNNGVLKCYSGFDGAAIALSVGPSSFGNDDTTLPGNTIKCASLMVENAYLIANANVPNRVDNEEANLDTSINFYPSLSNGTNPVLYNEGGRGFLQRTKGQFGYPYNNDNLVLYENEVQYNNRGPIYYGNDAVIFVSVTGATDAVGGNNFIRFSRETGLNPNGLDGYLFFSKTVNAPDYPDGNFNNKILQANAEVNLPYSGLFIRSRDFVYPQNLEYDAEIEYVGKYQDFLDGAYIGNPIDDSSYAIPIHTAPLYTIVNDINQDTPSIKHNEEFWNPGPEAENIYRTYNDIDLFIGTDQILNVVGPMNENDPNYTYYNYGAYLGIGIGVDEYDESGTPVNHEYGTPNLFLNKFNNYPISPKNPENDNWQQFIIQPGQNQYGENAYNPTNNGGQLNIEENGYFDLVNGNVVNIEGEINLNPYGIYYVDSKLEGEAFGLIYNDTYQRVGNLDDYLTINPDPYLGYPYPLTGTLKPSTYTTNYYDPDNENWFYTTETNDLELDLVGQVKWLDEEDENEITQDALQENDNGNYIPQEWQITWPGALYTGGFTNEDETTYSIGPTVDNTGGSFKGEVFPARHYQINLYDQFGLDPIYSEELNGINDFYRIEGYYTFNNFNNIENQLGAEYGLVNNNPSYPIITNNLEEDSEVDPVLINIEKEPTPNNDDYDFLGWYDVPQTLYNLPEQGVNLYNGFGIDGNPGNTNRQNQISISFPYYVQGVLIIEKEVIGKENDDSQYEVTITLKDKDQNPINGNVTSNYNGGYINFINGEATIEIVNGDKIYLYGIAGYTYSITEAKGDYYTEYEGDPLEGIINEGNTPTIKIINYFGTGDLEIEKTVVGTNPDPNYEFLISISTEPEVEGEFSGVIFVDGVGQIKLKQGQNQIIEGLPIGTVFEITETDSNGASITYSEQIGIIKTTISTVTITNTFTTSGGGNNPQPPSPEPEPEPTPTPEPGDLIVQKVTSNNVNDEQLFSFTVTFTNSNGTPLTDDIKYKFNNSSQTETLTPNASGQVSFELYPNTYITFIDLPNGTKYSITENNNNGYLASWSNGSGTITTTNGMTAVCTNTLEMNTGTLKITKQAPGSETNTAFNFNITLNASTGNTLPSFVSYTKTNPYETGEMSILSNIGNFSLLPGQSIFFTDLEFGTQYSVTEQVPEGYRVSWSNNVGTISDTNITPSVTAINTLVNMPTNTVAIEKYQQIGNGSPTKNPLTYLIGDTITYTINVINNSSNPVNNLIVTDTVPSEVALITDSINLSGVYDPSSRVITWNIPNIGIGQVATVVYSGRLTTVPKDNSVKNTAYLTYNDLTTPSNTVEATTRSTTINPGNNNQTTINPGNNNQTTINSGKSPKTGVENNLVFWILLILISCIVIFVYKYRQGKNVK